MKLINSIKLYFKEGNSDKTYEVDLCEVEASLFVVNFRYGRRDGNLKEGTKTVFPVSFQEAEKVYDALVTSKKKKGYSESISENGANSKQAPIPESNPEERDRTIVNNLFKARSNSYQGDWKLSRMIWRAGELKLKDAVEHIIDLADTSNETELYSACYALGRIKDKNAVATLKKTYENAKEETIKRISLVALINILEGNERSDFISQLLHNLPYGIKTAIENKNDKDIEAIIREHLVDENNTNKQFIWFLYLLSFEHRFLRSSVVSLLAQVPFKSNYFKYVRYIYKATEVFEDFEVQGLLAYRFSKTTAKFNATDYYVVLDGKWVDVEEEKSKGNHILSYTKKTRAYFNKRILRNLIKIGIENKAEFVELATQILLPINDSTDRDEPFVKTIYNYDYETQNLNTTHIQYDAYSKFITFNYILYANSKRYEYIPASNAWVCTSEYKPGDPITEEREEAFPHLWNKAPNEIIRLLTESKAERVHAFACKVFKANPDFEKEVNIEHIIGFLNCPFEVTNKLGIEIAKKIYDPSNPSIELVIALLNSRVQEARTTAFEWIEKDKKYFEKSTLLLATLLCNSYEETSLWLKNNFPTFISSEVEMEILTKLIEIAVNLEGEKLEERAINIGNNILAYISRSVSQVSEKVLANLIHENKNHLLILAGKIIMAAKDVEKTSAPFLSNFLQSDNASVRQTGLEIFGKFSERSLLDKSDILASFCISQNEDVRKAVRPIIRKLVAYHTDFAKNLICNFIPVFLRKEPYKGLHEDLFALFESELKNHYKIIPEALIFKLLHSKHYHAQLLGAELFKKYVDMNKLSIEEIVKTSDSEILEVRELCNAYFSKNISKIKYEKDTAIKLLDAKWEDSRKFAFEFFEHNFTEKEWEPDLLIRICDSVKDDVQLFGRKMILKFFKEENGIDYLIKLSQHPSHNLQLFVSNFVDKYASGKPEIIGKLIYYFKTVLRQVNKGSVAKKRVFQFLENEALKNMEVAQLTLDILNEVSLSIAKGDKAKCLEIMLAIKAQYPEMPSIIKEKTIETK